MQTIRLFIISKEVTEKMSFIVAGGEFMMLVANMVALGITVEQPIDVTLAYARKIQQFCILVVF